jgi:hypothetical protein
MAKIQMDFPPFLVLKEGSQFSAVALASKPMPNQKNRFQVFCRAASPVPECYKKKDNEMVAHAVHKGDLFSVITRANLPLHKFVGSGIVFTVSIIQKQKHTTATGEPGTMWKIDIDVPDADAGRAQLLLFAQTREEKMLPVTTSEVVQYDDDEPGF